MNHLKHFSLLLIALVIFSNQALANPVFSESERAAIQELNQISERAAIQKLNQIRERAAIQKLNQIRERAAIQELNQIIIVTERDEQDIQRKRQSQANTNKRGSKENPYALLDDDVELDKNTLDQEVFGSDPDKIQNESNPDPQNPEIFNLNVDDNGIQPTEERDELKVLEQFEDRLR